MIQLLRPCCAERFPDGSQFGEWGPRWGYHFDGNGIWIPGRVCQRCKAVVLLPRQTCQECGGADLKGQHGGPDIEVDYGTMLSMPYDTENVIRAGWQVENDHKHGWGLSIVCETTPIEYAPKKIARLILTLAHLSEAWVKEGSHLAKGDAFGKSGDSGNVSGPHLHTQLEIPSDSYPRTPLDFAWTSF